MNTDEHCWRKRRRNEAECWNLPRAGFDREDSRGSVCVHNTLGAGFLEKVYANSLALELRGKGISCEQEVPLKVRYKDAIVGDYVADIVVERRVLLELKACAALDAIHEAQIMNYLRASTLQVGLLMNFGRTKLQYRRFVC